VKRWVPFTAVAAANCINIPLMRQRELIQGVAILDENGNKLGQSQRAAVKGIAQVCLSRIFMAGPPMSKGYKHFSSLLKCNCMVPCLYFAL